VKNLGIFGLAKFALGAPGACSQLRRLYRTFKPDVVVGVGGYASVLPVIVAKFSGIPSWTHEAERHPGLANKVLAYFADRMSLAFSDTEVGGRVQTEVTGHPVRPALKEIDRHTIKPDAPKRLLVIGGSLGARGLDQAVPEITSILKERGVEVVHQCREESIEKVLEAYKTGGIKAHVVTFIDEMEGALEWADIVISRAGASSVAELGCVNRPTIFVPYPHQQGTHQTDNARTLVDRGKALLVEETKPQFGKRLHEALMVVTDRERFRLMKEAPFESKGLDAAQAIARGVLSLVR
jgi:UDP-N-acetylglucosamine--N-acetylmuramyl-(pentapeptide) pyrophosphoryl-undecaprenol N-acetylglucosamine transferase